MRAFTVTWLCTTVVILSLGSVPSGTWLIALFIAIVAVAMFVPRLRGCCAGVLVSIGCLIFAMTQLANHQLNPSQVSTDLTLQVKITSVPERDDYRTNFTANVLACESCEARFEPRKLRLSWYGNPPLIRAGEIWRLTVKLKPPGSLRNPGGFDAVKWAIANGLHAKGYVRKPRQALRIQPAAEFGLGALRQQTSERLLDLPSANASVGLIAALSLGVRQGIEAQTWQLLRDTGTAHLLAISGLHISLVAAWGYVAGRQIARCWALCKTMLWPAAVSVEPRTVGLLLSFILAGGYAALAGFGLPTQRALVMLSVWIVAAACFRFLPPAAALCVALGAVMLVNPLNPLSVGFWLSFGTVSALFYLHKGHQVRLPHSTSESSSFSMASGKMMQVGKAHLLISIILLPVTAWFFQSGSLVAPLANLLAVPWTGLTVVPLSLISACLSSIFPALADQFLALAQWAVEALIYYLATLDAQLKSSATLTLPNAWVFALCLCGLTGLYAPRGLGFRWLALPLLTPALLFNLQREPMQGFELHVLDVGQGLAALVFTEEKTLLFDTGGKVSSKLSMFEAVVMPYLHAKGRRTIDTVVISHADEDHSFGVGDVLSRFPDINVISSQPLDLPARIEQRRCVAGDSWSESEVSFSFIHPAAHDRGSENNLSCVLLVYAGAGRVLLTGDIEMSGEKLLADRIMPGLEVTVLVAPHHGSSTSSSQILLDVLKPNYVVFPSGQRNRYGFPHAEVQLRYKVMGTHPYTTGRDGAIAFRFGESGLLSPPVTWWHSHRRFWHGIINPDCRQLPVRQSHVLRMLELAQKGQTLCGK